MGAGMDTRPFWHEPLKSASVYIEVDTKPVNDYKNKIHEELKS